MFTACPLPHTPPHNWLKLKLKHTKTFDHVPVWWDIYLHADHLMDFFKVLKFSISFLGIFHPIVCRNEGCVISVNSSESDIDLKWAVLSILLSPATQHALLFDIAHTRWRSSAEGNQQHWGSWWSRTRTAWSIKQTPPKSLLLCPLYRST